MGNTLYLECGSGISGDMFVASLLDLGADRERLQKALKSLPLEGFQVRTTRVKKAGLDVCDFEVVLEKEYENHDHDMEYLYGHLKGGEHPHDHAHVGEHSHDHGHAHRGLPEIRRIIGESGASERAKQTALRIFQILAQAEAKAHGVPIEEVHFHEVGAVDSIVDVMAAAVCLDDLDVTEAIVPFLCEGTGSVRCQHGILPIPVPAVANIVKEHRLPLRLTNTVGELVTPTGAAIAAAITTSQRLPGQFVIQRIGLGGGKRVYDRPNILRSMLIQAKPVDAEKAIYRTDKTSGAVEAAEPMNAEGKYAAKPAGLEDKDTVYKGDKLEAAESLDTVKKDTIYKLESNIDDCTGEQLGYVMEQLLEAGARDVHYIPVYMKKNRPAYELAVICDKEKCAELEQIIFRETTTIGIRRMELERSVLPREIQTLSLDIGEVKVKKCTLPDGRFRYYPEYDSLRRLAKESDLSYQQVSDAVKKAIAKHEEV